MRKNPHRKDSTKQKKAQTVIDEQNEPCCRAICKKIRNANKKLAEITDLQKKDNLKPEQLEKINRKAGLLDQRSKQEEFLEFYKDVLTENAKQYREVQLKELSSIAEAIAIASWSKNYPDLQKKEVSKLQEVLADSNDRKTLQQRTEEITAAFNQFAENKKVKAWVSERIVEKGNCTYLAPPKAELSTNSPKPKAKQVPKVDTPKPEKIVENTKKEEAPIQPPAQIETKEKKEIPVEQPKEEKEASQPTEKQENPVKEVQKDRKERNNDDDNEKRNRNRRNKNYEGKEYRENKRKYKSKPKDRNQEADEEGKSDSADEEARQVRQFGKEETKKLYEDGFIVVGKPKPKAHDQKNWHDHTHGQKSRHHEKQNH